MPAGATRVLERHGYRKKQPELPVFASRRQLIVAVSLALLGASVLVLTVLANPARNWAFVPYWLLCAFAASAAWRAARSTQRASERLGWRLLVVAMLVAMGTGVARALTWTPLINESGPSIFTLGLVYLAYGLGALAIIRLSDARRRSLLRVGLDLALIVAGGLTIYAIVLSRTFGADITPHDFRNPLLYLPFVAAAFAIALLLGLSNGVTSTAMRRAAHWAIAGSALLSVAHFWLVTAHFLDVVGRSPLLAVPFALGLGFLGMAALSYAREARRSDATPPKRTPPRQSETSVWWHLALAILPYSVSMIGAGLLLLQIGDGEHGTDVRLWSLFGALLIFCIGAARQILYYADNRELYARLAASHRGLERQVREQTAVLRRRNRDLEAIHEVALTSDQTLDIHTALHGVAARLGAAVDGDYCRVSARAGGPHDTFEVLAEYRGRVDVQAPPQDLLNMLPEFHAALRQRTTLNLEVTELPEALLDRTALEAAGIGAALLTPLHSAERLVGYIEIYRYSDAPFTRDDVFVAESIGAHVGLAMANAAAYEQARFAADHDSVTGLLNHRALQERLVAELERCGSSGAPLTVAMIDLNNFKEFNDRLGHQTGDEVLHAIGAAIAAAAPPGAHAGRYGGDEFTLLMPGYDQGPAGLVVDAIIERVRALNSTRGDRELEISLAAGLATFPRDASNASELMARADQLMYRDKWRLRGYIERRRRQNLAMEAPPPPLLVVLDVADSD